MNRQSKSTTELHNSLDDFKILLAFEQQGSLAGCSMILSMTEKTIRQRLKRLEDQYGSLITPDRKYLTETGLSLANGARQMINIVTNIAPPINRKMVRFAALDGVCSLILMPRLPELLALNPEMNIFMDSVAEAPDFEKTGTQIYLGTNHPISNDNLSIMELGYTHAWWFAAQSYVDLHGKPKDISDFGSHFCVYPFNKRFPDPDKLWATMYGDMPQPRLRMMMSSTDQSFRIVQTGVGISPMPSYSLLIYRNLVPIMPFPVPYKLYLTVRISDQKNDPNIQKLIRFLQGMFDSKTYPWFGKDSMHPDVILKKAVEMNLSFGKL